MTITLCNLGDATMLYISKPCSCCKVPDLPTSPILTVEIGAGEIGDPFNVTTWLPRSMCVGATAAQVWNRAIDLSWAEESIEDDLGC